MDKLIAAFPDNLHEALEIASKVIFKIPDNPIHHIVVCGMGGSGIGGKIVAQWGLDDMSIPILSVQDYNLPEYVGKNSLVIGSSYSGNTEETLTTLHKSHEKGAHIIGICSGGEVQSFCAENKYDCVIVPGGNPPRTALAFSVVQLMNLFIQLGFMSPDRLKEIQESKAFLEVSMTQIKTEAKKLAGFIKDTVPVFYAASKYEAAVIRARQQFNENSKLLCWHHVIPEMNHNELVGWGGGDERFAAIFFDTHDLLPRNEKRLNITVEQVKKWTSRVAVYDVLGKNQIERTFYLIHLVDWASWYLSELKNSDAMDIAVIDYLKNELANF
jgi:glucose/mannose-6-phosphate isomerase